MEGEEAAVFLTLSFLMVVSGVLVIVLGLRHRLKIVEMAHRERLAMIDKGLVPPPERALTGGLNGIGSKSHRPAASARRLSFGIAMIGWGAGIALLFTFAFSVPGVGVGFGGAFAAIGVALIVAALVTRETAPEPPTSSALPVPPPPAEAPPPLGPDRP